MGGLRCFAMVDRLWAGWLAPREHVELSGLADGWLSLRIHSAAGGWVLIAVVMSWFDVALTAAALGYLFPGLLLP